MTLPRKDAPAERSWNDFCSQLEAISKLQLSDRGFRAWSILRCLWGLDDRHQQDINAPELAGLMGKGKAIRGHEAIEELVESGLLVHAGMNERDRKQRHVRGRYIGVSLIDPRDANGPRRQPCDRRGEQYLPGLPWHDAATAETGLADQVVRIRREAAEGPPAAPEPCPEAPNLAPNPALLLSTLKVKNLPRRRLGNLTTSKDEVLSTSSGAEIGAKNGVWPDACLAAKVTELRTQIPGLWLEIAQWVIDEAAGLHEPPSTARGRFTSDDVRKIVATARGKHERGELLKSLPVYAAGAFQQRFRDLGLRWPEFKATRPNPA